jgi:hypothetical protein
VTPGGDFFKGNDSFSFDHCVVEIRRHINNAISIKGYENRERRQPAVQAGPLLSRFNLTSILLLMHAFSGGRLPGKMRPSLFKPISLSHFRRSSSLCVEGAGSTFLTDDRQKKC